MLTIVSRMESTLGANIRALRLARKWSERKLGEKVGVSGAYIHQLEAGTRQRPNIELTQRIAAAFGLTVDELVHGKTKDDRITVYVPKPPDDPELEEINANLLTMRELDPEELEVVDLVLMAMLERLKKRKADRDSEGTQE